MPTANDEYDAYMEWLAKQPLAPQEAAAKLENELDAQCSATRRNYAPDMTIEQAELTEKAIRGFKNWFK